MSVSLANKFVSYCIKKKIYVSLAESCTGGLISSKMTSVANASKVIKYCLVTYSNESKHKFLKVPLNIIHKHGAVSEETAYYMTKGLSKDKKINFSLAITGIACPSGGSKAKPVGLVYFSFFYKKRNIIVEKKIFKGNRNKIREEAANDALKRSIEILDL